MLVASTTGTMQKIEEHIARRQADWTRHPFFMILESETDTGFLRDFAVRLSFWPLAFQDVLRILSESVHETGLRAIARHHAAEDRDHDLWFLQDLVALGATIPDANAIFRADHEPARRAAFAIVAQAITAKTSAQRIVVLLALEATGHVFFTQTARHLRRLGVEGLAYFSESPLAVEQAHALFEEKAKDILRGILFDEAERAAAIAVVDTCFDALETMFAHILSDIARAARLTAKRKDLAPAML